MKTKNPSSLPLMLISLATVILAGCATPKPAASSATTNTTTNVTRTNATAVVAAPAPASDRAHRTIDEFRQAKYPVDGRNFTPVDKNIAKLGVVKDDEEGSLNPYVLAIAGCYPTDGSYPYRCKPLEYDLYNGVTQDLWYKGRVVAKGHPNWT